MAHIGRRTTGSTDTGVRAACEACALARGRNAGEIAQQLFSPLDGLRFRLLSRLNKSKNKSPVDAKVLD
jgi:hypothetical protein